MHGSILAKRYPTNMPQAFIHPAAIVEDPSTVGIGTRVWAFTHILKVAQIGDDCNICDHVFIEVDQALYGVGMEVYIGGISTLKI